MLRITGSSLGSCKRQNILLVFSGKDSVLLVDSNTACGNVGLKWSVSRASIKRLRNHTIIIVGNSLIKFLARVQLYV